MSEQMNKQKNEQKQEYIRTNKRKQTNMFVKKNRQVRYIKYEIQN